MQAVVAVGIAKLTAIAPKLDCEIRIYVRLGSLPGKFDFQVLMERTI